jgi:hypothetical protein
MNYTLVCEIENLEFWSRCGKILMKKKHTLVCEIENPEFWSHCGKIPVKKNHTLGCEKNINFFFKIFFSKTLNFGPITLKFR